eukprot:470007-Pelagomonas_calceolata.AAC.1
MEARGHPILEGKLLRSGQVLKVERDPGIIWVKRWTKEERLWQGKPSRGISQEERMHMVAEGRMPGRVISVHILRCIAFEAFLMFQTPCEALGCMDRHRETCLPHMC